ncbi:hypothetical protein M6B38_366830 [Iris pallida]|uniref:Uncharacterized protein n=1 Tax=Iris pallida TaxID=29817 RepID=A0AAX6GFS8_IRIPA|nr:hypothetical protein M6B38_400455 [Iris pallida]KAJ6827594.1 hypothetical protein M6B38_366830 [Iris pallida]
MGFYCTSLITRKLRWRYGYEPLRLATVVFQRHALGHWCPSGDYTRSHYSQGSCDERFVLNCMFILVWLEYLIVSCHFL